MEVVDTAILRRDRADSPVLHRHFKDHVGLGLKHGLHNPADLDELRVFDSGK